jgi:hypothetical protein
MNESQNSDEAGQDTSTSVQKITQTLNNDYAESNGNSTHT